jgi:hypothetical protein
MNSSLLWRLAIRMETRNLKVGIIGFGFACSAAFAANIISTIDSGGQRTTSASYTMDGSVGGIGGVSTVASPPETVKHGYIGQLSEVISVSVTGVPVQVNEGSTSQLGGNATMDDASMTLLSGGDLNWASPVYPIASITTSGLATASVVYSNAVGTFSGSYLGATGSNSLLVVDSSPDNYGSYAGDGLPDWWQVGYFGMPPNPNAAPTNDVTGTGQNNLFKYVAGLDPTNATSVFKLRIENVVGQPDQKKLTFLPWASGRTYTTEYRTNLVTGAYTNLTGYSGPTTNGTEVSVTDLNAVEWSKFYRIRISLP